MSDIRALLSLVRDLWRFSRESRRLAVLLLGLLLLALGAFILAAERSVVLPFVYTLF